MQEPFYEAYFLCYYDIKEIIRIKRGGKNMPFISTKTRGLERVCFQRMAFEKVYD